MGQKKPNMFKTIILSCIVAVAIAASVQTGTETGRVEADKEYLTKQKAVLQLLHHVHQPIVVPELKEIVNTYNLEQNVNNYNNVECVKHFLTMYKTGGMITRKEVFSPLYKNHVQQAKTVFEVLYNAKDWTTFYNTAVWMREHINDGVFVYAFSIAVIHRPDTKGLVLPPFYEVCPHYFVSAETIQRAFDVRMQVATKGEGKDVVVIPTNYTGWFDSTNPELRTSYFTEDVGLNAYHYLYHLTYPNWLEKEYYGTNYERKGELFWYVHQQILAHYKLERLSNNMYPMKNFTFDEPNIVSYYPNLRYRNGKAAPMRPSQVDLRDCDVGEIERVKDFERRIRDAIDCGYVMTLKGEKVPLTTEHGIDILGSLVEKAAGSVNPKYYGAIYQTILNVVGHIVDPYHQDNVAPSVLQHFETMLRDPMYYRLLKRVIKLFGDYKKTLPVYTKEKLGFPGVTVESVTVDKLMTYFENFDFEITNVLSIGKVEDDKVLKVVARQPRLNHKEFTYRITVNCDKDVMGIVRVYLAPKYSVTTNRELSLNEKKYKMILIDRFPYQLTNGKTVIERSSKDSTVTVDDMTSFRVLYKQVDDALQGKSQFYINEKGHQYGYPSRLILPKGKKSGMPYTMYVVVTPYHNEGKTTEPVRGVRTFVTCGDEGKCTDTYPMGFPFDREIVASEYDIPNIYHTDVTIYHKPMEDTTGTSV